MTNHETTPDVELGEKTVPITLYLTQDERVTLSTCALLQMYRQDDLRYREVDEVRRLVTRQRWQAISSLLLDAVIWDVRVREFAVKI